MKLGGKSICPPNPKVITITRGEEKFIFKVGPVSFDVFDEVYPEPKPPIITKPTGEQFYNVRDKKYLSLMEKRAQTRTDFIAVRSLSFTDDLEWEKVNLQDPETWNLWREEMQNSGLTEFEIVKIFNEIMRVNSLTEDSIDDAEKGFLPIKDRPETVLDLAEEQDST